MGDIIRPEPSIKATIIGQVALAIWALSVVGAVALKVLPVFEVLFGIFTSGFLASAIINTVNGNWQSVLERPRYLILIGVFGIVGNDLFYIMAFRYAPAVQVDLIVCLWPMLVFIFAYFLLSEDIRINHIIACIIAFSGICFLLTVDADTMVFKKDYLFGYLLSLLSAILWAIYMVVSKKYSKPTPELFAVYCFAGMIFSAIMHLLFEETVIPTTSQLYILIIMGVTTHSLAYYGWDYAIKRGHFKLLHILPYGNPILSVLALVVFGFAELTKEVLIATLMVFIAGIIGGKKFGKRENNVRKKRNVGVVDFSS